MAAPEGYFDYPHRAKGLDHSLFEMRYLKTAPGLAWGNGKSVALWITVGVDFFPLDMPKKPFMPTGGMSRPYPDIWNYSSRDYGNRVGIYRMMKSLAAHGVKATAFVNAAVAERYPVLMRDLLDAEWEIAASGYDMGHLHHGGMPLDEEKALVEKSVGILRDLVGERLKGWHSPAFSESFSTPALVAEAGLEYIADWVNDDMPFAMQAGGKSLTSLPMSYELSDTRILFEQNQSLASFEAQVLAAFEVLKAEATPERGRILSISLSPWVIGQPYRIQALNRLLGTLLADANVFSATGDELLGLVRPALKEAA